MTYLPEGCGRPNPAVLDVFWADVRRELANEGLPGDYQVRWIGLDAETTAQILDLIVAGDKTGTFTLPWIVERTGQPPPTVGDAVVLVDFDGHPRLLVRLTHIETVRFGDITTEHTSIDGTPVRDLAVWRPLHTRYWNAMLEPFALTVSDEMPVWVERFELLSEGVSSGQPVRAERE